MHRLAAFLVDCNLNDNAARSLTEALREVGARLSLSTPACAAAGGPGAPRVALFVTSPPSAAAAEAGQGPRRLGVSMQVLIKPSAFETRDWFQKLARLPELATAGPFGGEAGASALSEAFSQLVGAAEASAAAAAAAAAPADAAPARPLVAVPGYSQRTSASLMRVLDLIRESEGGGGGGGGSASSRFSDAAAAAAAGRVTTAAGIDASSPPSSSPLATIYVITHALSDPVAFAPALRAAAADRVGVTFIASPSGLPPQICAPAMLELAEFARRVTQGGAQAVGGGAGAGGGEDDDAVVDFGGAVVACFPCDPAAYRQIAAVALRELLGMVPAAVLLSIGRWDREQQQEEEERSRRDNEPSTAGAFGGSSVGIGGRGGAALLNGVDFGEEVGIAGGGGGGGGGGASVLPGTPRGGGSQEQQRQQQQQQQQSTTERSSVTPSKLWALATGQAAAAAAAENARTRAAGPASSSFSSSSSSSMTLRCVAEAEVLPLLGCGGGDQEVRARPLCPCHGAPLFDRVGSAAWPAALCTVTGEPVLLPPRDPFSPPLPAAGAGGGGGFGRSLLVGGAHPLQLGARARPAAARNSIILPPKGVAGRDVVALPPPVLTAVACIELRDISASLLFGCPLVLSPDPLTGEGGAPSSSSAGGGEAPAPTSLEGLAALAEALRARTAGLVCLCDRALCEPGATAVPASPFPVGLGRRLSAAALYLLRAGSHGAALMVQRLAAADESVPTSAAGAGGGPLVAAAVDAARAASDARARAEANARVSGVPVAAALRAQGLPPGVDPGSFARALGAGGVAAAALEALLVPHAVALSGGGVRALSTGIAGELAEVSGACIAGGGVADAALAVPPLPAPAPLARDVAAGAGGQLQLTTFAAGTSTAAGRRGAAGGGGASRQKRNPLAVSAGGVGRGRRAGGGAGRGASAAAARASEGAAARTAAAGQAFPPSLAAAAADAAAAAAAAWGQQQNPSSHPDLPAGGGATRGGGRRLRSASPPLDDAEYAGGLGGGQ